MTTSGLWTKIYLIPRLLYLAQLFPERCQNIDSLELYFIIRHCYGFSTQELAHLCNSLLSACRCSVLECTLIIAEVSPTETPYVDQYANGADELVAGVGQIDEISSLHYASTNNLLQDMLHAFDRPTTLEMVTGTQPPFEALVNILRTYRDHLRTLCLHKRDPYSHSVSLGALPSQFQLRHLQK